MLTVERLEDRCVPSASSPTAAAKPPILVPEEFRSPLAPAAPYGLLTAAVESGVPVADAINAAHVLPFRDPVGGYGPAVAGEPIATAAWFTTGPTNHDLVAALTSDGHHSADASAAVATE